MTKQGGRPDLTRPEVAALLGRVFDLDALNALPPMQASDVPWLIDWIEAANAANKLLLFYGAKPGPQPDLAAIERNMTEYEDQYAAAINFLIRSQARQAVSIKMFMAGLAPKERTRVREKAYSWVPRRHRRGDRERRPFGDLKRRQARQRPPGDGRHPRYARGLGELFPAVRRRAEDRRPDRADQAGEEVRQRPRDDRRDLEHLARQSGTGIVGRFHRRARAALLGKLHLQAGRRSGGGDVPIAA